MDDGLLINWPGGDCFYYFYPWVICCSSLSYNVHFALSLLFIHQIPISTLHKYNKKRNNTIGKLLINRKQEPKMTVINDVKTVLAGLKSAQAGFETFA
ncbi:DUF1657 domain-containing protein, partial [Metabacillus herbersteinensis]